eukprot:COSAG01_NODE_47115_length_393_cov_1.323129_1_plen_28_part_10
MQAREAEKESVLYEQNETQEREMAAAKQ